MVSAKFFSYFNIVLYCTFGLYLSQQSGASQAYRLFYFSFLTAPFVWYGFIIAPKKRFVQSEKAIADYRKKLYQNVSRI